MREKFEADQRYGGPARSDDSSQAQLMIIDDPKGGVIRVGQLIRRSGVWKLWIRLLPHTEADKLKLIREPPTQNASHELRYSGTEQRSLSSNHRRPISSSTVRRSIVVEQKIIDEV